MASDQSNTTQTGLPETQADMLSQIFDYKVLDNTGDKVGTVNNLWPDYDGTGLSFVGVRTGWLFGKDHVVPADGIEIDHANKEVRLPLSAATIKAAPDFNVSDEILDDDSSRIRQHYGYRSAEITDVVGTTDAPISESPVRGSDTTEDLVRDRDLTATTPTTSNVSTGATTGDQVDVPLREEHVKVGKRSVDAGAVRLRRIVRTETVNVPVELRRDDVVVERVEGAAAGTAGTTDRAIGEDEITIPLTREEAVVQKTTDVTGAVRVRKTHESHTENVSETVRKEDVEVDREGDATSTKSDLKRGL